jgi:hypothetical protein
MRLLKKENLKNELIDKRITQLKIEKLPKAYMVGSIYALWQCKDLSLYDIESIIKSDYSVNYILDMIAEIKRNQEILEIMSIDPSEIDGNFDLNLFIETYSDEIESMYENLQILDAQIDIIKHRKIKREPTLEDLFIQ